MFEKKKKIASPSKLTCESQLKIREKIYWIKIFGVNE